MMPQFLRMFNPIGEHVETYLGESYLEHNASVEEQGWFSSLMNGPTGNYLRDLAGVNSVAKDKTLTIGKRAALASQGRSNLRDMIGQSKQQTEILGNAMHKTGLRMQQAETARLRTAYGMSYLNEGLSYARRGVGWMFEGTMGEKARKLAIPSAALGIDVAHRYATGGTWDKTSDGKTDIVGIPFI